MSVVQPFSAIRFRTDNQNRDITTRLAPPYDVLGQDDKDRLLAADPKNFVKIDLPYVPPKSAGPAAVYEAARQLFQAWLADGTMVRDERPQIYVYHQRFKQDGTQYVRKMFFARLRLEPFGAGSVFPHERTFGGPKEDRLALMKATRVNLSPIFGLYEDARNEVSRRLEQGLPVEPLAKGTLDGVENLLWGVADPGKIDSGTSLMKAKPIYIADGHHRYGTGLLYRDFLIEQNGPLPDNHPANFVLCVFCAMEDPGLLILPTHRVLPNIAATDESFRSDPRLQVQPLETGDPAEAIRMLARLGPQAVALYVPATRRYFALRPKSPNILDDFEPGRSAAWRGLGLAFLHAYLFERVVAPQLCDGKEPTIQYVKSARDAIAAATDTRGVVFLMQPTTMQELRGVCSAGDLMPQKSTYFYPKLASGLVVNPLSE